MQNDFDDFVRFFERMGISHAIASLDGADTADSAKALRVMDAWFCFDDRDRFIGVWGEEFGMRERKE